MTTGNRYKTKQKDRLLAYLKETAGHHVTAADVCEHFKSEGGSIGQSTVYRQLESLVDQGLVNKYIFDAGTPACFEYVGSENHVSEETCFHCKCEKCGKLIHLNCEELMSIESHLASRHGFKIDPLRTVLYGLCDECTSSHIRYSENPNNLQSLTKEL